MNDAQVHYFFFSEIRIPKKWEAWAMAEAAKWKAPPEKPFIDFRFCLQVWELEEFTFLKLIIDSWQRIVSTFYNKEEKNKRNWIDKIQVHIFLSFFQKCPVLNVSKETLM